MNLFCKRKAFLSVAIKPSDVTFIFWVTWIICCLTCFYVHFPFFAQGSKIVSEEFIIICLKQKLRYLSKFIVSYWHVYENLLSVGFGHCWKALLFIVFPPRGRLSSSLCGRLFTTAISWIEAGLLKVCDGCPLVLGLYRGYKRCYTCPSVKTWL